MDDDWLEIVIQSMQEGIVAIDSRGQITFFSRGAELITGCSVEEALYADVNQIFKLADGGGRFLDSLLFTGSVHQFKILSHDGKPIMLAVTAVRVKPMQPEDGRLVIVLRDITEGESVQHLQSLFIASITHEFRTPLSALNASVEFLLEEMDLLSKLEIKDLLCSIHLSVTGLQTLIDNLLESINIEAGCFTVRPEPTVIRDTLDEAIRIMQPLLDRRQQQLVVHQLGDLPMVKADPTRLIQVLVNLISNASKFGPMEAEIDLTLEHDGGNYVRVTVADRGPGIPPAEKAYLFRRFSRRGIQNDVQYGLRLGLSVVKAIVDQHGGEVSVTERPGGGSNFWFKIPIIGNDL